MNDRSTKSRNSKVGFGKELEKLNSMINMSNKPNTSSDKIVSAFNTFNHEIPSIKQSKTDSPRFLEQPDEKEESKMGTNQSVIGNKNISKSKLSTKNDDKSKNKSPILQSRKTQVLSLENPNSPPKALRKGSTALPVMPVFNQSTVDSPIKAIEPAPESPPKLRDNPLGSYSAAFVNSGANSKSSNIKVIARFRPLNATESEFINNSIGFISCDFIDEKSVAIKTDTNNRPVPFHFDRVFDINTSQAQIYDSLGRETILDVVNGYNGTILTYGQSGSGKTFTMYGSDIYDEKNKGLIPRAM